MAVQWPSRLLHRRRVFFHPLNGSGHGSHPSLTTRDRELVSVLEVRIEPGDLNQRPLTPQSVTLPTLPLAGCRVRINNDALVRETRCFIFIISQDHRYGTINKFGVC